MPDDSQSICSPHPGASLERPQLCLPIPEESSSLALFEDETDIETGLIEGLTERVNQLTSILSRHANCPGNKRAEQSDSPDFTDASDDELKRLRQENSKLKSENLKLEEKQSKLKEQLKDVKTEKSMLEVKNRTLSMQVDGENDKEDLERQVQALKIKESEFTKLKSERRDAVERLNNLIENMWKDRPSRPPAKPRADLGGLVEEVTLGVNDLMLAQRRVGAEAAAAAVAEAAAEADEEVAQAQKEAATWRRYAELLQLETRWRSELARRDRQQLEAALQRASGERRVPNQALLGVIRKLQDQLEWLTEPKCPFREQPVPVYQASNNFVGQPLPPPDAAT